MLVSSNLVEEILFENATTLEDEFITSMSYKILLPSTLSHSKCVSRGTPIAPCLGIIGLGISQVVVVLVPVPEHGIDDVPLVAFDDTVIDPLYVIALVGAKVIVTL